jgi:hypothetical protein
MARLTDLPPAAAKRYAELECPQFKTTPWVKGAPLAERRVAIVSSAGLVVRGEKPFRGRDADYRVIPSETRPEQLMFTTRRVTVASRRYLDRRESPSIPPISPRMTASSTPCSLPATSGISPVPTGRS